MTKFSLSSHHKGLRVALYSLVFLCCFVSLVNISVSVLLNNTLKDMRRIVAEARPGFSFQVRFAYFNLLRGVTMYGLECRKDGALILSARQSDLGFDLLSLKDKKIRIKNIRFRQARLDAGRLQELSVLWDKTLWKFDIPMEFFETTYYNGTDLWLNDMALADVKGYFSSIKGSLWVSRGHIVLKKLRVPAFPEADLFGGSPFYKPFDYIFEAESSAEDFVISRFEIVNPDLKFAGLGRIEDVGKNPRVDIGVEFLNIVLDNFPALNRDYVLTRGVVDARLRIEGGADDLKTLLNVKFSNVEANFFDALAMTRISGTALVERDRMVGENFSLFINDIPFDADFVISQGLYPHMVLYLASLTQVSSSPAFAFELEADGMGKELAGKAKTRIRYAAREATNTLDFELEDFRVGYEEDLFVSARTLKAAFQIEPEKKAARKGKSLSRSVELAHAFCVMRRDNEEFVLDNVKAVCYGGTIEGRIGFLMKGGKLTTKGEGHLREVNLGDFFESAPEPSHQLSGRIDGDLRFDTGSVDMVKGQLFVSDGLIEQNPLLNAVSDFLGVPSLKKVDFDELSVFFSGGRGEYTSQVKLESPRVKADLDGKITGYDKMDGYLSIGLATELMNESKQFKKILTYIRHDEPSVLFSFKISSYLESPRVLWLKNEFKDKLSNLLPERNKRFLQRQVNIMVEKMEPE